MAIIKSGATSDQLTIDATSKAARVTSYDTLGNNRGVKKTYRAATNSKVVAAASTQPFFIIQGSATKTIIVQRIRISGMNLTAVAYLALQARKFSTAISGGTATALTQTPMDSTYGASTANLCQVYTAAPTAGTLVGTLSEIQALAQATTAAASGIPDIIELDFRVLGAETHGVYLRGTAEGLGVGFGVAPATAVTLSLECEWTEE
jgi:hypothetical protein